jgi:hypothetical protein
MHEHAQPHIRIALMMEAVHTSETSVYSETTWRYISEGSNLHMCCHENLKSHNLKLVHTDR